MLKNYFKTAWRNMLKHKTHTTINLLGMTVAFICCILLTLVVYVDFSFDNFHRYGDRVYELYNFNNRTEGTEKGTSMAYPVTTYLKQDVPAIDRVTRIRPRGNEIRYGEKSLDLSATLVDNDFFDIFTFPIVKGQKTGPLYSIDNMVINQTTAKNLFGDQNPIGKSVEVKIAGTWHRLTITAVMEDAPKNSSFKFAVLARTEIDPDWTALKEDWDNQHHVVFVRLAAQANQAQAEKQLRSFVQQYRHPDPKALKNDGYVADANGEYFGFKLLPLKDLHFNSALGYGESVSKTYLFLLLLIGAVILSIASFNFVNLQISRSFTRKKEFGVRKCLGAAPKQVWGQLFMENLLPISCSFLIGIVFSTVLLKASAHYHLINLDTSLLYKPLLLAVLSGILLFVALLSTTYPYAVMNRLKTVEIFQGKISIKSGSGRNILITLQFSIAVVLICTTAISYLQFRHLRTAPLGYKTSSLISIPIKDYTHGGEISAKLRSRLASDPSIVSVSGSMINLGVGKDGSTTKASVGFKHEGKTLYTAYTTADFDFLKTLSIKPLEGSDFTTDYQSINDSTDAVIITESMAKQLHQEPLVGLTINQNNWHIVGIIPDFHLYSLHEKIEPLTIALNKEAFNYLLIRVNTQNFGETMERVKKAYLELKPGEVFNGSYVDENVDRWYKGEQRLSMLFSVAASVAIALSCMGLFGLALIIIGQKVKEIGIRKVLGASVNHITVLVTREFIKPVIFSILIAIPIAYWVMHLWLQDFIYRIAMPWWVFPLAGMTAVLIAILTVGIHAIKAALANPVDSLRNE